MVRKRYSGEDVLRLLREIELNLATGQELIVLVAPGDVKPDMDRLMAFRTNGQQGINIKRNLWHGPLTSLHAGHYLVVDRKGPGENGEVFQLSPIEIDVVSN